MKEILSILMIGIALSMDAFSISLSLGIIFKKTVLKIFPILVGIFHFLMPFLGNILGIKLTKIFNLSSPFLFGMILIILALDLLYHYVHGNNLKIKLNIIELLFLAFSVSLDSFMVGFAMDEITNHIFLALLIISLCSFLFTYLGLLIGRYSNKYLGKYSSLFGMLILLLLGIIQLIN